MRHQTMIGAGDLVPRDVTTSPRRAWRVLLSVTTTLLIASWYLLVLPPEIPTLKVLALAGPGGVLGLAAGWAAFAAHRDRFTWRTGMASALVGVAVLPPIVGTIVMLSATLFPGAILSLFIAGAWIALGLGALIAVVDRLRSQVAAARAARGAP